MPDIASLPLAERERLMWEHIAAQKPREDRRDAIDFPVSETWAAYYAMRGLTWYSPITPPPQVTVEAPALVQLKEIVIPPAPGKRPPPRPPAPPLPPPSGNQSLKPMPMQQQAAIARRTLGVE